MESEAAHRSAPGTVMASIDGDFGDQRLIIADVSRDDAWLSMPQPSAPSLTLWR